MPSVHSHHDLSPSSLSRIVNKPCVVLWCNAWDQHRIHTVWCFGSVQMHQPWESHRVRCTTNSIHLMSWYRRFPTISSCDHIHYEASFHPSYHHNTVREMVWRYCSKMSMIWWEYRIWVPSVSIDPWLVTPLFASFLAIASELSLGIFVVLQVISECLSHDGLESTADQFQWVLELNIMVFDLHFLVLGGWNDFYGSFCLPHRFDEFHDECEIVVRSIVEVHWQSVVLLVEWEL